MGRKAHSVFDHFIRGPKLANNSNRYEQNCRYCNAHFGQGRPDSLRRHLIRTCPSVPADARNSVVSNVQIQYPGLLEHGLDINQSLFQSDALTEFHGLDALASASLGQPFPYTEGDGPIDPQIAASLAFADMNETMTIDNSTSQTNMSDSQEPTMRNIELATRPRYVSPPSKIRKTRGAFSDSRKLEIHEVRKKGACLRCRSLNKVCGTDDPCKQCQKIAHDRTAIWQFGCIRIENGKTFSVINQAIFTARAQAKMQSILDCPKLHAGMLNVRHLLSSEASVTFTLAQVQGAEKEVFLIIHEDPATMSTKTSELIYAVDNVFDLAGAIPIREALKLSKSIAEEDDSGNSEIYAAIKTWIAVYLLTSSVSQFHFSRSKLHDDDDDVTSGQSNEARVLPERLQSGINIIFAQIQESVERTIDKQIFMRLDRNLSTQKYSNKTALFFTVLILLSAAEMYTWYLCDLQQQLDCIADDTTKQSTWPFPDSPSKFAKQGHKLATLYNIWTHCRHITPLTRISSDGILETIDENVSPSIREWFERSKLSMNELHARDGAEFVPGDRNSLDGKFWAQLFIEKNESMRARLREDWFGEGE